MADVSDNKTVSVDIDSEEPIDPSLEKRICQTPKNPTKDYSEFLTPAQLKGLRSFFGKIDGGSGTVKMVSNISHQKKTDSYTCVAVRGDTKMRVLFGLDKPTMGSTNAKFNQIFSEMATDTSREITFKQFLAFFYERWKLAQDSLFDDTISVVPLAVSSAIGHRVMADNLDATVLIEIQDGDDEVRRGSGVLLDDGYILTATKVIKTEADAAKARLTFFNEEDAEGFVVNLNPSKLFHVGQPIEMQGEILCYTVCAVDQEQLLESLRRIPKLARKEPPRTALMLAHQRINAMMGTVNAYVNEKREPTPEFWFWFPYSEALTEEYTLGPKTPLVLIEHSEDTGAKGYSSLVLAQATREALLYDVHRALETQEHKLAQSPGSPIFTLKGVLSAIHMKRFWIDSKTRHRPQKHHFHRKLLTQLRVWQESFDSTRIQAMSWGLNVTICIEALRRTIHYCTIQAWRKLFAGSALECRRLYRKVFNLSPSLAGSDVLRALEFVYMGDMKRIDAIENGSKKKGEPPVVPGVRPWDRDQFAQTLDLMDGLELGDEEIQIFSNGSLYHDIENKFLAVAGTEAKQKIAKEGDSVNHNSITEQLAYLESVKICTEAIGAKDPECAALYIVRGIAFMHLKKNKEAIKDFQTVLSIEQKRLEQFPQSIKELTEAIRLNDKIYAYNYIRAGAYMKLEEVRQKTVLDDIPSKDLRDSADLTKAIADYTRAINLHPKFCYAFYNRGRALSAQMKLSHAIKDFNTTLKLDPDHAACLFNRGMCYQKKVSTCRGSSAKQVRIDWMKSHKLCPKKETVGYIRQVSSMLRYPDNLITPRLP
eukprot:jgi/Bigna1/73903/fgenesh1_pg.26_\